MSRSVCVCSLSACPASLWALDGSSMAVAMAQQVFRLSTAQDNVQLEHTAKNVATQASLIHLVEPKEAGSRK